MAVSDAGYAGRNAVELARLRALGARLLAGDLQPRLSGGWTPAAVLAHLAFWDRFTLARWDRYDQEGVIEDLPEPSTDLVNAAGLPLWRAMPEEVAMAQALEAAVQVSERITSLGPEAVSLALATDRMRMLDRTLHWGPHLDELAAKPPPG
jgi:hypothetical protein